MKVLVMKFGGAALDTPEHFTNVAEIIMNRKGMCNHVVVVVSAMRGITDDLTTLAYRVAKQPIKREMDMLISVGERISMALLAMSLKDLGIQAISLTGSQSGIITCNHHSKAHIIDVQPWKVQRYLQEGKVVIVAGFQGISIDKEITTLGRGGSDTSAVALGISLGAEKIEFYKDVKGIYSEDPKKNPKAELLQTLSFENALTFQTPLHPRSIALAFKNHMPLHVMPFKQELWAIYPGTWIIGSTPKKRKIYENPVRGKKTFEHYTKKDM